MIENLTPQQCWDVLQQNPAAVLVDVRTKMEHLFVGHPSGAVHIAWKEAPDWQLNSNFVAEVSHNIPDLTAPILLLCRSGQRSLDAAKALEAVGYRRLINIVDGFEGPLDTNKHRGNLGGWRFCGLPWQQS
ncbi:Rhodanese-related sulfurtransferase [Crenothrix polyspora]|uniref:Rhodanese-related sulfurtransferase n=1 Tax=Crenothrix polyspora TaxID=360316 RepID=A0A1R4H9T7_9GAMM|nr:rhodanese-like domain-containing protein [Crenothrix polyspora]SJM93024.1 Rhodanese-related sulfurtransferase [Crenothrix polyspora]